MTPDSATGDPTQSQNSSSRSLSGLPVTLPENVNILGDKERQIFGGLSARAGLQLVRTDLFGYDPPLEVCDGGPAQAIC